VTNGIRERLAQETPLRHLPNKPRCVTIPIAGAFVSFRHVEEFFLFASNVVR
jgi:hypothetical protein